MNDSMDPLRNILQNSMENLVLAEKEVEGKIGHHKDDGFNLHSFWTAMNTAAKKLSFECTKICISFGKPPLPTSSETSSLLSSVEQAVVCLVSLFHKLPLSIGLVLHTHIQCEVLKAIQATKNLLKVIKDGGGETVYRHSTGVVWEGCKNLENAQMNNKSAVLLGLKEHNSMVADAFREISEELEGSGSGCNFILGESEEDEPMEDNQEWTEEDKNLIGPSINLIKAAKILYKRVIAAVEKNGQSNSVDQIKELDELHEESGKVSSQVDVLVQELYPPLSLATMEEQSEQLAVRLHTVLKMSVQSHVVSEAEQSNMEFVQKAVDHNLDCMREKLTKR